MEDDGGLRQTDLGGQPQSVKIDSRFYQTCLEAGTSHEWMPDTNVDDFERAAVFGSGITSDL